MASSGAISFSELMDMTFTEVEQVEDAVAGYHEKMNAV